MNDFLENRRRAVRSRSAHANAATSQIQRSGSAPRWPAIAQPPDLPTLLEIELPVVTLVAPPLPERPPALLDPAAPPASAALLRPPVPSAPPEPTLPPEDPLVKMGLSMPASALRPPLPTL